ncbi:efflux RND transporter periplasmic adaptor subunit [Virgisporangium aurantiacum]|uniref:efflux RND transporter periplasmic adaptor subunit n=1 Tax=Virgisporangium aurantiacum TaxID=175570 RepID=UPI0019511846|nr:HlyD family efflux transporter periplasmic adaptor subunit [Virgisporangium aurantiacum]
MRRPPSVVAAFLVIAAVLVTAASCSDDSDDVGLGTAGRADVTEVVDAPATVTARAVATLSSPAEGTLGLLAVEPGATVAPGQVLAVIDSPKAQQQLATAEEALNALSRGGSSVGGVKDLSAAQGRTDQAAAAAFAQAREAANKITDPGTRTALLTQVDAAEAAYKESSASARALITSVQRGLASVSQAMNALTAAQRTQAKAAYDLAKSTVDALTLRAPVAGVVQLGGPATTAGPSITDLLGGNAAALGAAGAAAGAAPQAAATGPGIDPAPAVGTRVSAGTTILTVVDLTGPGLLAEVDETDVLLVTPGIKATVELDAAPGARYEATVRSVDLLPSASAQGGVSYRARLALGAGTFADGRAAPAPRPGMSAVSHLSVRSADDVVVVPAASVFNADGRDQVWVVRNGKAERMPVTVGVAGTDLVQITDGVNEGDRVVVRGADQVRAGQKL